MSSVLGPFQLPLTAGAEAYGAARVSEHETRQHGHVIPQVCLYAIIRASTITMDRIIQVHLIIHAYEHLLGARSASIVRLYTCIL
jgi:hypothetical protein